jgi:hypothetical protein
MDEHAGASDVEVAHWQNRASCVESLAKTISRLNCYGGGDWSTKTTTKLL